MVRAAHLSEGGAELLAVLPISAVETGNVTLNGNPLRFLDLPYSVAEETE